jgi:Tesmin/TSO1-like CXC domain, cysteine-rich domain
VIQREVPPSGTMPRPELSSVDGSRQNFTLPAVNIPQVDDGKRASRVTNHSTTQTVGASARFHLPPRYRSSHDDEHDDVDGNKIMYQTVVYPGPKPYIPSYDCMQRTARPAFHFQYQPTNHPVPQRTVAAAGAPNWSSWASAVTVGTTELAAWRQPFDMRRAEMGHRLSNGMPALVVRQETATTERSQHSSVATLSPQVNASGIEKSRYHLTRPSDTFTSANGPRRPIENTQTRAAVHPHVSYATLAGLGTQNPTANSIQRSVHSHGDIGWHHRIGNAYKYHTVEPPEYSKPFASPSTEESKLPHNFREFTTRTNTTKHAAPLTSPTEKRLLSPPRESHTKAPPQFKKAKGFDKLDLLCTATLEIGELHDNPTGCSCPKSKCVALYCDCFKAGRRCHPDRCSCLDCKNTIAESGVDGARTKAIRSILARNPRAFTTAGMGNPLHKLPPGEIACNCVHSRCLKLYCSCFHNKKVCNPKICTCVRCGNTTEASGDRQAAIQHAMEKRADAFVIKPKVIGQGCACKNNKCLRKYCECFRTDLQCTPKCRCRDCENRSVAEHTSHSNEIVQLATTISSNSSEE